MRKRRCVEKKGHKSRSDCWVLGKVGYEVDRGIVAPLMKWHSWLCIPLDIYTQVRSLSQLTHIHNHDTFNQSAPVQICLLFNTHCIVLSKQLVNAVFYNYIAMETQLGSPSCRLWLLHLHLIEIQISHNWLTVHCSPWESSCHRYK